MLVTAEILISIITSTVNSNAIIWSDVNINCMMLWIIMDHTENFVDPITKINT